MTSVVIIFSALSIITSCVIGFILYKKLPTKDERLKLIIPILIGFGIGILFCLFKMRPPTCEFGRFM